MSYLSGLPWADSPVRWMHLPFRVDVWVSQDPVQLLQLENVPRKGLSYEPANNP